MAAIRSCGEALRPVEKIAATVHPVHHDDADRQNKPRPVPALVAVLIAAAVVALLAYLRWRGIDF